MGHEVVPADPEYGLVGPAIVPRGMAGVAPVAERERRRPLQSRGPDEDARPFRPPALGPAAACLARGGAGTAPPPRPDLRPPRPGPDPDHGQASRRDLQARRARLLGDQHRGGRGLPLRVRLERRRLAGDQRPGREDRGRDCRSAPSSSGPKTARRCCSNWRGRSSARWVASSRRPTRAAMRRPGQSRAAASPGGRTRRGCDRSRDGRDRARTRAGCGRRGPRR